MPDEVEEVERNDFRGSAHDEALESGFPEDGGLYEEDDEDDDLASDEEEEEEDD